MEMCSFQSSTVYYLKMEKFISVGVSLHIVRNSHVVFFLRQFSFLLTHGFLNFRTSCRSRPIPSFLLLLHVPDQPLFAFSSLLKVKMIVVPLNCCIVFLTNQCYCDCSSFKVKEEVVNSYSKYSEKKPSNPIWLSLSAT